MVISEMEKKRIINLKLSAIFSNFFSLLWKKLKLCGIIIPKTQNTNKINETSIDLHKIIEQYGNTSLHRHCPWKFVGIAEIRGHKRGKTLQELTEGRYSQ